MGEAFYYDAKNEFSAISDRVEPDTFSYDSVNERIYELYNYLPLLYNDKNEKEYIETLFNALGLSYSNKLYQFAYIQFHMIFMVCIYYMLLQINEVDRKEIEKAIYFMIKDKKRVKDFYGSGNTRNGKLYFGSFAVLGECDVFLLLKIVGLDSDLQGELETLVKERNHYAHANGNITITSQTTIDEKINKYINSLERLYDLLKPMTENLYTSVLTTSEFSDLDIRQYYEDDLQIKEEFIRKYFISQKQLNTCRKFNISTFSDLDSYDNIKNLHIALSNYYKGLSDDETAS